MNATFVLPAESKWQHFAKLFATHMDKTVSMF